MINYSFLILIISVTGNSLLGIITILSNPKSATNKLFLALASILSLYVTFNYLSTIQTSDDLTIFWIRMIMCIALFIGLLFFLFIHTFPYNKLLIKPKYFFASLIFTILLVPLVLSPLVFSGVDPGTNQPIPGPGIGLFMIQTLTFTFGGIYLLIRKYIRTDGREKAQLKLLLIGTGIMFFLIFITNVIFVVILNIASFVGLLPIYTTIFAGTVAYAIVKHKMFDVKVFATQALTVIIWIVLFSKLFAVQSQGELIVDTVILLTVVLFGVLLVRSVSNEVKQREKLQELTEKLQALDKQKDEFINMVAHELRAPMTAIKGYISMIMDGDAGVIPKKARGYLTDVSSVNDRLVRLVNNMLNVSRIEEGRLVYKTEAVKLSDIAKNVMVSFKFEAQRKNLEFNVNMSDDINDTVMVDADRLTEIIGNFVSNAVKYTEEGSIDINITQPNSSMVRLAVKDTGPGISKSEQEKLFQKFYRVQSTAGKTIGTGLGLYISKLLVEKFNGTMGIISDIGRGSEFWFEIPVTSSKLGTVSETNPEQPIA